MTFKQTDHNKRLSYIYIITLFMVFLNKDNGWVAGQWAGGRPTGTERGKEGRATMGGGQVRYSKKGSCLPSHSSIWLLLLLMGIFMPKKQSSSLVQPLMKKKTKLQLLKQYL
jgi:hypothetical protein